MQIVIIGGGFCGFRCARLLEKKLPDASITLFDKKPYFEYTPSIHKALTKSSYLNSVTTQFSSRLKRTRVIAEKVDTLTSGDVRSKNHKVPYDYAIIACGISYPIFLEDATSVFTVKDGKECCALSPEISKAKSVLVMGGGLIGVETAGELAQKTNAKITIVHPGERLIDRNPSQASAYAQRWLERHDVKLVFGEKVVDRKNRVFITDKGRKLNADIAFWCAGIKPHAPFFNGIKDERGYILVNEYLQAQEKPNIFAGGDITGIKEEKTAQNANIHAGVIVTNLVRLCKGRPLMPYKSASRIMIISLGDYNGIACYKNLVLTGVIPAILKKLVELWER